MNQWTTEASRRYHALLARAGVVDPRGGRASLWGLFDAGKRGAWLEVFSCDSTRHGIVVGSRSCMQLIRDRFALGQECDLQLAIHMPFDGRRRRVGAVAGLDAMWEVYADLVQHMVLTPYGLSLHSSIKATIREWRFDDAGFTAGSTPLEITG